MTRETRSWGENALLAHKPRQWEGSRSWEKWGNGFFSGAPRKNQPCWDTLTLAQCDLCHISDTSNCKVDLCCKSHKLCDDFVQWPWETNTEDNNDEIVWVQDPLNMSGYILGTPPVIIMHLSCACLGSPVISGHSSLWLLKLDRLKGQNPENQGSNIFILFLFLFFKRQF